MPEKTIISASKRKLFGSSDLKEFVAYKDLLFLLVLRDITAKYKQSVLGVFWAAIRPLFTMVVFTFFFGKLAGIKPEGGIPYPLFSFAALIPWFYFATAFSASSSSLISSQSILTKVYFPRIIIPLTPVLSGLLDMGISLLISFVFLFWYKIPPTINLALLPLLILVLMIFVSGMGFWLSALSVQYRDVQFLSSFLVQILMYASPIIFPLQLLNEKYHLIYALYPMVGIIEGFRSALTGTPIPWELIEVGAAVSVFIFITGLLFFNQRQRIFADVV